MESYHNIYKYKYISVIIYVYVDIRTSLYPIFNEMVD